MQTSEQQTEHFQNESIQISLTRHPGSVVKLDVTLNPAATKEIHESAVKEIRKEVSIPGFRKGKAPDDVVRKNFASVIEKQFRDLLLQGAFKQALELTKVAPFSRQAVKRSEIKKCSLDEGALCHFMLEIEPTIPKIDPATIETRPEAPRQVEDKHIERGYKELRVGSASWQEVTDRPLEIGDFAEVDIDVIEHPAHNVCTNQLIHVDKDELPKWLYDTLQGMNVDETKEVLAQAEPNDPRHLITHDENSPSKKCLVVLKKIKVAILPQEDEEFAKKFGASSIEELKQKITERIKNEEEQYAKELSRYNLRRELLQKYPVDLPGSVVEAEVRGRMAFCKSGADLAKGSLPSDQKDADLRMQIEAEARGFFSWMYLLRQYTSQVHESITTDELQQEFNNQMQLPRLHRLIYQGLTPEDVRHRLFMLVMMRKCEDHLIQLAGGNTADKTV